MIRKRWLIATGVVGLTGFIYFASEAFDAEELQKDLRRASYELPADTTLARLRGRLKPVTLVEPEPLVAAMDTSMRMSTEYEAEVTVATDAPDATVLPGDCKKLPHYNKVLRLALADAIGADNAEEKRNGSVVYVVERTFTPSEEKTIKDAIAFQVIVLSLQQQCGTNR